MSLDNIKKVELEITSGCNAACPGCARTQNLDILDEQSFTLEDLKRIFPTRNSINGKIFKFCGVLGDPAYNVECVDMVEYLAYNGGWCQLSTNGGIQPAHWWEKLGNISRETNNLDISFCVDGHEATNYIYRVNVVWRSVMRNMQAYSNAGGQGTWIYIVFDHNEHELDKARTAASDLGFKFATRTGMRNSYHDWVALIKKKDKQAKKVITQERTITTTGKKEHSKVEKVAELVQFTEDAKQNRVDLEKIEKVVNSIQCKYIHEGEIFIGADQTMWPCCFLYDSAFKNKEGINDKLAAYGKGWNSLKDKTIEQIMQHEWFAKDLYKSWYPDHKQHLPRCIKTCAYHKAYHNEIKYEETNDQ